MKTFINDIKNIIECIGGDVYIIGGYIREKLLKIRESHTDLDIVYDGDIKDFINHLEQKEYIVCKIKKNEEIYRTKLKNRVIDISKLKENDIIKDLSTRDFTINTIALKLIDNKIIDPFRGRDHINARLIHEVNENSIKNDPIRILRGIRFVIKYGMHFSNLCEENIKKQSENIQSCSKERIFTELMNIIHEDKYGIAFEEMDKVGIIKQLIPYVDELKLIGKCKYHIEDAFTHMNLAYKNAKDMINGNLIIKGLNKDMFNKKIGLYPIGDYFAIAAFCHDIGKARAYKKIDDKISFIGHDKDGEIIMREVCNLLGFPKKAIYFITQLVKSHMHPLGLCKNKVKNFKKAFYKLFSRYNENIPYILALSYCDMHATKMLYDPQNEEKEFTHFLEFLLEEYKCFQYVRCNRLLKGDEIINITGAKGEKIQEIINNIDKKTYYGELQNREDIIVYLKNEYT